MKQTLILSLFSLVVFAGCGGSDLSGVRSQLAQAKAEQTAAAEADQKGDGSAAQSHAKNAAKVLADARVFLDSVRAGESRDTETLRLYAEVAQLAGDSDLAVEAWKKILAKNPDDTAGWRSLAECLGKTGTPRLDDAIEAAREVITRAGESATAADYALLGRYFTDKGLFDVAEQQFMKGIEKDSASQEAQIGLLGIRIRQGRMAEAATMIEQLGQVSALLNASFVKAVEEGLDGFSRNRVNFQDTAENHFAYAKVLLRVGRMKETLAATEHTVRLAPDNHTAWNLVASIYRQMGAFDKAREAYNKSLAIVPDQPRTKEALDSLAKDEEAMKKAAEEAAAAKAAQPAPAPTPTPTPATTVITEGQAPEPGDIGPIPMPSAQQ